ncbi:MAG: hypothetical protein NW224_19095 [Leptolyngbyaceae cyanobacterium bins.302]|nr:hypothetical protein [Leptolyngbyaceae cyanobacterium bins.302]
MTQPTQRPLPILLAALSVLTSAIAPLTYITSATAAPYKTAQLFPGSPSYNTTIPAGTRLPTRYDEAEKIVVAPDETVPVTLTIARTIRLSNGTVLVPAGSKVSGRVQPVGEGSQFVADTLILPNGTRQSLSARSDVITKRQEVQPGVNGDALIKGSAIGAGASAILSGLLGNRRISLGKILLGAGAGAAGGLVFGKKKAEVIVIDSKSDLYLTLDAPLTVGRSIY